MALAKMKDIQGNVPATGQVAATRRMRGSLRTISKGGDDAPAG